MSDPTLPPNDPVRAGSPRPLHDRVRDRVLLASDALERGDQAWSHGVQVVGGDPPRQLNREVMALRQVFSELGITYRQYRRRTGEPLSLPLRAAATAFKHEPSLLALVPVAGFLDDLKLLDW